MTEFARKDVPAAEAQPSQAQPCASMPTEASASEPRRPLTQAEAANLSITELPPLERVVPIVRDAMFDAIPDEQDRAIAEKAGRHDAFARAIISYRQMDSFGPDQEGREANLLASLDQVRSELHGKEFGMAIFCVSAFRNDDDDVEVTFRADWSDDAASKQSTAPIQFLRRNYFED